MHARILCYSNVGVPLEAVHRSGRDLAGKLGKVSGFVSFVMLDLGAPGFTCVFVCNESVGLDEADRVAQAWLGEQLGQSDPQSNTATTGEVVLQHGL